MPFSWIVPSAVWLVLHFTAGSCRREALSGGRAAGVCAKGNVTASTSSVIRPGTNVTLSCHLRHTSPRCKAAIYLNHSEHISSPGDSVSKTILVTTYGNHTFTCYNICPKKELICGIDIECGNPPDEPRNVSCIQNGTRGHPTCTWDKGRATYICTDYEIQLSNGTDSFRFREETPHQVLGSVALSKLHFDSNYTLVVFASNELGNSSSQPFTFTLMDIVKPHPPRFLVEFDNSSATNCTLSWHDEARAQHCRLRYGPHPGPGAWSTVEILSREEYHLQGLEPDTAYKFQVSCRILPGRGFWSDWSTSRVHTPAAAPSGILDVWYRQQDLDSERQNLSIFWKALSKAEAGGRILGYTVTLEALEHGQLPAQSHQSNQTRFSRVTPRVAHRVTVTARNSRGSSGPAAILTRPGSPELPPPQRVSAVALGNSSILVSWSPPVGTPLPIEGYVVEWAEPRGEPPLQPRHSCLRLPPSRLSAVITEHIRDNVCYQIHVSALHQDRAGQAAAVRGNSTAQAPSAGPQMVTMPLANGVLVSWQEIPAAQQRGCITAYLIYLHRRDRQGQPEVHAVPAGNSPLSLHIADLEPGEHLDLWMTAVTAAGEGPQGNSDSVFLERRKVFQGLLSLLVPQWQSKAIPDPANATWAKSLTATKVN
ncbi:interleukin-12 receptor subunit beta-2 [Sylvia borin]